MALLTFETREALLTLEQNGKADAAPVIVLKLHLSNGPTIYISGGKLLQAASWSMTIRSDDSARDLGSLSYADMDGKGECQAVIHQSASRFRAVLDMFRGGHASEISLEAAGMAQQDDYSSHWNTEDCPTLAVLRVSFEFPLPQSEA